MKKITTILTIIIASITFGSLSSQPSKHRMTIVEKYDTLDTMNLNDEIHQDIDTIFSRLDLHNKKYNWAMDKGRENEQSINAINQNLKELSTQINEIQKNQSNEINRLAGIVQTNKENIEKTAEGLDIKIKDSDDAISEKIDSIDQTVNKGSIYWIIGLIAVALLAIVLYILLRKQMIKQKAGLDSNIEDARKKIENTRKILEEEGLKLDNKLIEVLETQLKIINNSSSGTEKEANHTLALKVADEIIRIQKNLTRMDEKTKGLKQLTASVKRIQDNFASNGYEIVEMLGKAFNDGMKVSANFIPDEDLEAGQQIITRIIKPQVNYKGIMIQSAQIEVSQG